MPRPRARAPGRAGLGGRRSCLGGRGSYLARPAGKGATRTPRARPQPRLSPCRAGDELPGRTGHPRAVSTPPPRRPPRAWCSALPRPPNARVRRGRHSLGLRLGAQAAAGTAVERARRVPAPGCSARRAGCTAAAMEARTASRRDQARPRASGRLGGSHRAGPPLLPRPPGETGNACACAVRAGQIRKAPPRNKKSNENQKTFFFKS